MKQIGLLTLAILFSGTLIQAQTNKTNPEMAFEKTVDGITSHDYGSIVYGANGKVDFVFTNKGTKPLVISDVKSSCGCTVPNWTKEPVGPGQKGSIKIEYNTKLPGVFNKTVVVYSNANNSPVRLEVRGKVNPQSGDLKSGKLEMEKQIANDRKQEESYGKVIQAGDTATTGDGTATAEQRKAKQKAAYQERLKKEQLKKAAAGKTETKGKKPAATVGEKSSGSSTQKK